jgi:biopolymer transport protein ExbB/TolQ
MTRARWAVVIVAAAVIAALAPQWLPLVLGLLPWTQAARRTEHNWTRRRDTEEARRTVEVRTVERNERIAEREAEDAARVESAPTEAAMPEGMTDEQRAEAERLRGLWRN